MKSGLNLPNGPARMPVVQLGGEPLSLRDYFAAQALGAIIAFEDRALDTHDALPVQIVAAEVYRLADAMLKEREK